MDFVEIVAREELYACFTYLTDTYGDGVFPALFLANKSRHQLRSSVKHHLHEVRLLPQLFLLLKFLVILTLQIRHLRFHLRTNTPTFVIFIFVIVC